MKDHNFKSFPSELKKLKRFLCWKYEENPSNPRCFKKPPIDPKTGYKVSPNDADTWMSFEVAARHSQNGVVDGIGLALTKDMDITVIDIDDCRSAKSGKLNPYAREMMKKFPTYAEVSPSGTGIHIILHGSLPGKGKNTKDGSEKVEVYDRDHYMTITGHHVEGTPTSVKRCHNRLQNWYATLTQPKKKNVSMTRVTALDDLSEAEIVANLFQNDNQGKFSRLWSGDTSGYSSRSEADLALCSLLSGQSQSLKIIDNIFRKSKLMRPKWDKQRGNGTYGSFTIEKALNNYNPKVGHTLDENSTEYEIAKAVIKRIGHSNLFCLSKQNWLWSSNGKSVLLKILVALVGEQFVSSVAPNQLEKLPILGHLHGKLLNVVTEIPVGAVISDAKLKSITSGELMNAAHKFGHPFDFNPYCTLIFSANHLPHTKDCSPAFFRRAEVLSFNRIFRKEECDTGLADKLIQEELPGILNFALRGLKRLYKRGKFTEVPSSIAVKREWELSADQVAAFIDEECELHPSARTAIRELYDKYKDWAEDSGMKSNVNKINLTSRLKRMGCTPTRNGNARMLQGVKLKYEQQ